jgi:anionic cell wall polymer biosynthesis LytR-Cps2A-Psr (LCP) family protein
VETSFVDEKYPIRGREDDECDGDPEYGCRFETIKFNKGEQLMSGETALKFTRSRNAEGDEGTDFARSKRQQKVIEAIKEKVLSREILLSPKKLLALRDTLLEYTETDIDTSAAAILARRVLQSKDTVDSHVLPEDLLVNPPKLYKYDNLYVFIPKTEGWSEVHKWVRHILDRGD